MREIRTLTQSQANDMATAMIDMGWDINKIEIWLKEHKIILSAQANYQVLQTARDIRRAPRSRALTYGRQ